MNVPGKYWILVFRWKFGHINICDSLVTNSPKTLLKVYLVSQTFTGLFFNCVFFQFTAKQFYWLRNIYYCLCNWCFPWWKGENSSFDTTLMRKQLLGFLQLEKLSPFPKTNKRFYRCRSTRFFHKQHLYKQHQAKIGKKLSKSYTLRLNFWRTYPNKEDINRPRRRYRDKYTKYNMSR